jgi:hypothetical protein
MQDNSDMAYVRVPGGECLEIGPGGLSLRRAEVNAKVVSRAEQWRICWRGQEGGSRLWLEV